MKWENHPIREKSRLRSRELSRQHKQDPEKRRIRSERQRSLRERSLERRRQSTTTSTTSTSLGDLVVQALLEEVSKTGVFPWQSPRQCGRHHHTNKTIKCH